MAYYCVHCDHEFEPEGEGRPRCPKCMRATELKPRNDASETAETGGSGRAWGPVVVIVLLVLGVGGWLLARGGDASGPSAQAKVEALSDKLEELDIDQDAARWLSASEEVAQFAEQAAGDASGAQEKAEAVVGAIRARAQAGAFVPWSLSESRLGEALPPAELLPVLKQDGSRTELYPLEVVAFAVAALRSLEVEAQAVELLSWPGAKAPLDPMGVVGYFALSVDGHVYDVFQGRSVPDEAKREPVSDAELVGAGLSLEALQVLAASGDTRAAGRLSEAALELAPKSPSVRCLRGAVLAGSGSVEQGLKEFEAANQLRSDAARRYNTATSAMLSMDLDRAARELNKLVFDYPDYALARVSIAAIQLQRGEVEEAERQLELAERAAPDLSAVRWGRAELKLAQGDSLAARALAERAFEQRPTLEAHMRLARLQRQASDIEGAASTVQEALEKVPDYRRDDMRKAFAAALGPAVMMDVETAERAAAPADPQGDVSLAGGDLDLSKGLKLLGDEEAAAKGSPSSLTPSGKEDGPLLLLGDPSKLRLRDEGNSELKLDLSP